MVNKSSLTSSDDDIMVSSNTLSGDTTPNSYNSLVLKSDSSTPSVMSSIDLENPKNRTPMKERINKLQPLINDESALFFDSECLKKRINWSKVKKGHNQIDSIDTPDPAMLLSDLPTYSPKLYTLINKIEALDKADLKQDGTLYKHMIFTDMKSNSHGIKMLASVFAAKGMNLGFNAEQNPGYDQENDEEDIGEDAKGSENKKTKTKVKKFQKIYMLDDNKLHNTKSNNFYIMSSVNVFDQPLSVQVKKDMLSRFNSRPDNVHGENIRFMLMDSGFKEGIDLYDLKYIHIFEPQTTPADQKQVIGRGTRTCGQKGLRFHPSNGWPLHVQIYDMSIPKELQGYMGGEENLFNLYLKSLNLDLRLFNFVKDLEDATIMGSVDHDLNKNIHSFKITGGAKKKALSLSDIDTNDLNPALGMAMVERLLTDRLRLEPVKSMSHDQMKTYINSKFSKHKWDKAKMENLCEEKSGGSGNMLTFTPTQGFIKDYFTPQAPVKGMLLWHSTGSGKTCSAIATASNEFEKQGYTILWVTRTTLKNDIWKNMFDMVCHEVLRSKISDDGLIMPSQQPKRMKLLSNSWRIRPMSYKQFSNLVSKKNANYDKLVKINGEHDPLRKTLIIVDEAHKLYGGGDLSSIERPDMPAFHKSLMHSYAVSGQDSVRLLLMTATPITTSPMEMMNIVNLCKPIEQQLPTHFDDFTKKYLNRDTVKFSPTGLQKYFDDIVGIVSYLNREKDARQFAQPIIHHIKTPIVKMNDVYEYDKRVTRHIALESTEPVKKQINDFVESLKGELSDLDPNKFHTLLDECKSKPYQTDDTTLSDKYDKKCNNVTKKHIRNIVNRSTQYVKKVRSVIKELKDDIKRLNTNKQNKINYIKEWEKQDPERWIQFKNSAYYNIRYNCGKTVKSNISFDEMVTSHDDIIPYVEAINECDEKINEIQEALKIKVNAYKTRIDELKTMIKDGQLNDIEKSVVRSAIKDRQKLTRKIVAKVRRETKKRIGLIDKDKADLVKRRKKTIKNIKNKIKADIKVEMVEQKRFDKESKAMKKIMRKTGDYKDEINNNVLKEFIVNEKISLKESLTNLHTEYDKELKVKTEKTQMKEDKMAAQLLKQQDNERNRMARIEIKERKAEERTKKQREKELNRMARIEIKEQKTAERTKKQREKELKKMNKTKKNGA